MRRLSTDRKKRRGTSLGLSLMFALTAFSATALAQQHAQPAGVATCASTNLTFVNQNSYPIWIGEGVQTGSILMPPGNNWELDSGNSFSVCVPPNWTSGTFWARTECNFAGTFGQDPDNDYVDCTSASQCCTTGNTCTPTGQTTLNNHICYGGKCVIDCSAGGTNGNCGALPNSVCVGSGSFCGFSGGVCRTGDCGSGLFQCKGAWDSISADQGPATPASQFEITNNSAADNNNGAATYDVTNLAGYNSAIGVTVNSGGSGSSCTSTICNTDL